MKKILILTSNPRNDLKLKREIEDLKKVIKRSQNQSQFEIEFVLEVYPEELQDLLIEHEPRIVHFCGHGTGEQGLVLQNKAGREQIVSTDALSNLFEFFDDKVECVLLNACYSEVQANAIVQHINYAIGMSHEIKDYAAIAFATGFYRWLGYGKSIEESYKFGRNAIQFQIAEANPARSPSTGESRKLVAVDVAEQVLIPEHLKPVLKKKSPLTPFPEEVTSARSSDYPDSSTPSNVPPELIEAIREEVSYKRYKDRARDTWDEFGQANVVRQPLTQNEYRQRKTLLNKVKEFWIEGFLKPSLYANAAINLDWKNSPDAVLRPFEGIEDIPVELDESFEELQPTEILNQTGLGKTLLILGEPGSGKTITLLQLAEKLVNQTEQDLIKPIPVVFNLSSWGQKQQPIEKWLIEEFKDKYQVPKTSSEPWLEQEQLILLLDGLDEVRAEQRNACVRALNKFIETHNTAEMVVCSRVKDYEALTERLRLSSAICIKPLSPKQVYSFLAKAGDSLAGLKTLLQQDLELEKFAQTPLILNIMSLAYQGWSAEKLLQQFRSTEDRYRHLFDSYIERMLRRKVIGKLEPNKNSAKYPQEKVLHWLSWLAKTMVDESKIIFLIEKMQPSLLQSRCEIREYLIRNFLLGALGGLVGGAVIGLVIAMLSEIPPSVQTKMNPEALSGLAEWLKYWWWRAGAFIGGIMGFLSGGYFAGLSDFVIRFKSNSPFFSRKIPGFLRAKLRRWKYKTSSELDFICPLPFGSCLCLSKEITLYERINWSFKKFKSRTHEVLLMLIGGIIAGLFFALIAADEIFEIIYENLYDFISKFIVKDKWIIAGLIGALTALPLGLLKSGLVGSEEKERTKPNQGIRTSWKNFYRISVIGMVIFGGIGALMGNLKGAVMFGLPVGSTFGLLYGGDTCVQHFNLRQILYRKGCIPWNYARFLDYASERLLMKKVGGGYIFYHRMLMEHFAQRNQVARVPVPVTPRQTSQPVAQANTRTNIHSSNISNSVPQRSNPAQNLIVCSNCGHRNPTDGKFCTKCGKKLTNSK